MVNLNKIIQTCKKQIKWGNEILGVINAMPKGTNKNKDITELELTGKEMIKITKILNAQSRACFMEKLLAKKFGITKISAKLDRGDFVDSNELYYELKSSFTNEAQTINLRQIRLYQDLDYYYVLFIDDDNIENSLLFKLNEKQIEQEVEEMGTYTHKTKKANEEELTLTNKKSKKSEYSISIKTDSDIAKRWKKQYLKPSLLKKILK